MSNYQRAFHRGLSIDGSGNSWRIVPRTGFVFPRVLQGERSSLEECKRDIDDHLQEVGKRDFSDKALILPSDHDEYRSFKLLRNPETLFWYDPSDTIKGQWTTLVFLRQAVDKHLAKASANE